MVRVAEAVQLAAVAENGKMNILFPEEIQQKVQQPVGMRPFRVVFGQNEVGRRFARPAEPYPGETSAANGMANGLRNIEVLALAFLALPQQVGQAIQGCAGGDGARIAAKRDGIGAFIREGKAFFRRKRFRLRGLPGAPFHPVIDHEKGYQPPEYPGSQSELQQPVEVIPLHGLVFQEGFFRPDWYLQGTFHVALSGLPGTFDAEGDRIDAGAIVGMLGRKNIGRLPVAEIPKVGQAILRLPGQGESPAKTGTGGG